MQQNQYQQQFEQFQTTHQLKSLVIDGITWEYFVTGSGSRSLLILPGGGSIAEASFPYIMELEKNFNLIVPTIPEVTSVKDAIAGITQILQTENVTDFDILGFSMGGMIGQVMLRQMSTRINKTILFVSMPPSKKYIRQYRKYGKGISLFPTFLMKIISKYSLTKRVLAEKVGTQEEKDFWVNFFKWEFDSGKMNKKILVGTTSTLLDYYSNYEFTAADLASWQGKLLIFEAEDDKVVNAEERELLRKVYPKAEIITLRNSGHFGLGLFSPGPIIKTMADFLAGS